MRGMPHTITIWNRYRDGKTDVFFRHVVTCCKWKNEIVTSTNGTTTNVGSHVKLKVAENALYKPYSEWKDLSNADKSYFFTFGNNDLVALGDIDIEMSLSAPNRKSDLKELLKPNVFEIRFDNDLTEDFKVSCGRHYKLSGV